MTRLNFLQYQKAILEAKKQALENKSGDIFEREQKAITDVLLPFFEELTPEVDVEVTKGSVYFKMAHPDYSYKKELFNIYLRENWKVNGFDRIDLSYYTTSTNGNDVWELKRLRLLGKLAEIVEDNSFSMLYAVNAAVLPFKAEYDAVFKEMSEVREELNIVQNGITNLEKEKIEFDLKNGGVTFEKGRNIQLKFNYSPFIKSIKLVDVSKSGKKATAVFEFDRGNSSSREENVNVQSIIDQVYGLRKNIVQLTSAE